MFFFTQLTSATPFMTDMRASTDSEVSTTCKIEAKPIGHIHNEPDEHDRIVRFDRNIKLRILVLVFIVYPLVTYITYYRLSFSASRTIGVIMIIGHASFFLTLYLNIYRSRNLYRVVPRYQILDSWAALPLPHHMDEYPQYAINSFSEFCSIRGSIMNLFLFSVGLFTFVFHSALYLMFDSQGRYQDTNDQMAALCSFGAGVGLLWIGLFELNPNDEFHQNMHMTGVLICCLSNIGFCLQQHWSAYSVLLLVGLLMSFVVWQFIANRYGKEHEHADARTVTRISVACIVTESVLLAFGAIAFNSYVFYFNH